MQLRYLTHCSLFLIQPPQQKSEWSLKLFYSLKANGKSGTPTHTHTRPWTHTSVNTLKKTQQRELCEERGRARLFVLLCRLFLCFLLQGQKRVKLGEKKKKMNERVRTKQREREWKTRRDSLIRQMGNERKKTKLRRCRSPVVSTSRFMRRIKADSCNWIDEV